ncbi:MAG TPA: hypothetical protein VK789_28265 [Bryobacteraceae bacterium]|jgi:bifunctional non-homologous end joining protein LigD|nr:hypothetical protein [Bryobacteraceae bacterium]
MTAQAGTAQAVRLEADSKSGGKFYTIFLVPAGQDAYLVNVEYGAIGDVVRTATKTKQPVPLARAQAIFEQLQSDKIHGDSHYKVISTAEMKPALEPVKKPVTRQVGEAPVCYPVRLLNDIDEADKARLIHDSDWWVQIKHDGDRVQLHFRSAGKNDYPSIHLFSGRSARVRPVPAALKKSLEELRPTQFVIDGELVGETIHAFDLLFVDGKDLREEPYESRHKMLRKIVLTPEIKVVQGAQTCTDKARLIQDARDQHAEGVVFVKKSAPYKAGRPSRGGDNLRWKFTASASVIVTANNTANGKESITFSLFDGTEIGSCSIIGKKVPEVGQIIEVEYLYCQGSLVQARLKGVREDVSPEECTRKQLRFKDGIDPLKGKKK